MCPRLPDQDRFGAAAEAEAHYLRMCRLRRLDADELRRLLGGDPQSVAPWIESAARYGVPEAQVRLGQMHLDGAGVAPDEASALGWFERAARTGSGEAMNMAGRCYENGWGAAEDHSTAARWYRLSARAAHDWGEYNYANMLFDGRGVAEDRPAAVHWYEKAARQGHARAMNLLARCLEEGWGVPRNPELAADWYRRSAESGYFRAQFNYGTLLAVAGRTDAALEWFEAALAGATPESAAGMRAALSDRPEPRLAALGKRRCESTLS